MKRNTRIIISITGIIIISLMLLGVTYGYFITQISGNTNSKSVEVTTGTMSLIYTDLTEETNDIIQPGYETTKTFTIENNGNVAAKYSIYIVDLVNNFNRTQDITYTLYRIDNDSTFPENYSGCVENPTDELACKIVVNNAQFPTTTSVVKADEILETPGNVYRYDMVITYVNSHENQNEDQGKTFSGKINIRPTSKDTNPYSEGTLAYSVYSNPLINKNIETPTFNGVATAEEGLYAAEDDYGTSWYFRGTQQNNYVNFAGFTWRIVRINGDGSIRLILDGTLDKVSACDDTTICTTSEFNLSYNDNAYVGYMYGLTGVTSANVCVITTDGVKSIDSSITEETSCTGEWMSGYDATHMNLNSSTIKTQLDSFYQKYLNTYNDYISDTMFCGDKTLAPSGIGGVITQLGYGTGTDYKTYYAATGRLFYSTGTTSITEASPTLKCAENMENTYSRYTINGETTNKGVETNGDLTYPIALLSADELVLAGAFKGTKNQSYYLYDAYENSLSSSYWWTMSPNYFHGSYAYEFHTNATRYSLSNYFVYDSYRGSRPVINLKKGVLVAGGYGTSGSPYTVKLPS